MIEREAITETIETQIILGNLHGGENPGKTSSI
jgi:hypothetical protein